MNRGDQYEIDGKKLFVIGSHQQYYPNDCPWQVTPVLVKEGEWTGPYYIPSYETETDGTSSPEWYVYGETDETRHELGDEFPTVGCRFKNVFPAIFGHKLFLTGPSQYVYGPEEACRRTLDQIARLAMHEACLLWQQGKHDAAETKSDYAARASLSLRHLLMLAYMNAERWEKIPDTNWQKTLAPNALFGLMDLVFPEYNPKNPLHEHVATWADQRHEQSLVRAVFNRWQQGCWALHTTPDWLITCFSASVRTFGPLLIKHEVAKATI